MSHPNIATALLAARNEFPPIHKTKPVKVRTKSGADYTFMYAPHDAINDVTVPVLGKHGLTMVQPLSNLNGHPAIRTVLLHESGESIEDTFPLPLRPDMTAQEVGSAITYVRRYAWVSMLGLVADEDDEGNHASGNTVKAGASSSAPQGQATAAAASRNETPAPAAASPAQAIVEKAQEAAQTLRQSQRPDIPHPTDRTTPKGDRIMEAVTFVKRKDDKTTKDGRPIYVFDVVLEGVPVEMTTMSDRTRDDAIKHENSTARVEFVESGRFKNLWGVHPVDGFAGSDFPPVDDDGIPF